MQLCLLFYSILKVHQILLSNFRWANICFCWANFVILPNDKLHQMERITLKLRTSKLKGEIKLRFRLSDTRAVDLYHKSSITANLKDLEKFNLDGSLKPKVTIYNRQLKESIEKELNAMKKAYHSLCEKMDKTHISGELFEKEIESILNPASKDVKEIKESMISRFSRFIERAYKENVFNEKRMKSYLCTLDSTIRFMTIRHLEKISADEFTADMLQDLYEFFADEYLYISKHKSLYNKLSDRTLPKAKRSKNTVIARMNRVQAFFNELLEQEEIEVSPFSKLGKKRRANMMKEEYGDPRFLRKEELLTILEAEVPDNLKETRDAFLLQCALGCRISEFQKLTMENVEATSQGIPFIHYLPPKTLRENTKKREIETPIVKFAMEIILRTGLNFNIIKYPSGKSGYNVKIRQLLKHCGIDRRISVFNEEKRDNIYMPIHESASNKICRSTHEDMMSKVQINLYVSGLHKVGSDAIHRYTKLEMGDLFALMCVAFSQPLYTVDKDLNLIEG